MRIKSLRVRNFTSLVDVDLHNLPNLVVFIGKNSSGKSNLIDALALFFTEFGTDLERHLGDPENYQHLFPQNDISVDPPPEISAGISLTPKEFDSLLGLDEGSWEELEQFEEAHLTLTKRIVATAHDIYWTTHDISLINKNVDFEIVRHGEVSQDTFLAEILLGVSPDDIVSWTNEVLGRLADLLKSNIQAIYTSESSRSWANRFSERPTILESEHVADLWNLSQSRGTRRQQWTRLVQEYGRIAPNEQRPDAVASSIQMVEGTRSIPIGMTGEGSQAMFRLMDQLDRGPQIMAIEEPETHLHPASVKHIGQLLAAKANESKQLFICTHSPFLVEQSSLENFFIVKKEQDRTQVSPIGGITGLKNLLLDIGMRPSDILFSNAILLVEGLSDETFFDHLSNKVDASLARRQVKAVRANGSSRGRRKVEFWAEVGRDSGLPLYLILDKDAQDEAEQAIGGQLISRERCLVLEKGNLEDYYPQRALEEVLSTQFNVTVEEPIPVGKRVEGLRRLLSRKVKGKNAWKPILAEEVAKTMTRDEAESETGVIVGFLRKIYHEVGVE